MPQLAWDKLKQTVENATDLTSEARMRSERYRDYYDNHQLTAEELAVLQRRGQPTATFNRIKRKVDAMVGIEQQGRVDPRAYARHPGQEDAAEVATKALVYVDDNTRFDAKRSAAFENLLVEGFGGVEIIVEPKRGQLEIAVNRLRWEELIIDPHSREKDFSDAAYLGYMRWMSLDDAMSLYGDVYEGDDLEEILMAGMHNPQDGETYEDRPFYSNSFRWADKKMRRVRVAQLYYKSGGKWYLAIFAGGGGIWNDVSPYLDEDGEPTCAIELMTAYIDRENRRYGIVEDMLGAQDEINKRRSKLLHQLNSRQTMGPKGGVDDVAAMKRELANPNGHIEYNAENFIDTGIKPFEILPVADQAAGQFQLLTEAKSEIDMLGPNASLLGQLQGDQSGRAIMAQQQAGFAELAPIYDSLRDWTLRCYRAMWARIKQFWTEERYIRISGENHQQEFIGLNVRTGQEVVPGPGGMPMIRPTFANRLGEMDVDIIIDDVADYTTLRQEQFEQLTQLAQQGIPVPPEMLIEASSLTNKAEILEKMQAQQQAMQQMQAAQMQAAMQAQEVDAAKKASEIQENMADAAKTQAEAEKTYTETQLLQLGYRA